jgi:hypothetical protein
VRDAGIESAEQLANVIQRPNTHVQVIHDYPALEKIGVGIPELRGIMDMFEICSVTNDPEHKEQLKCRSLNKHMEEVEDFRNFHFRQPRNRYEIVRSESRLQGPDEWKTIRLWNVNEEKKRKREKEKDGKN